VVVEFDTGVDSKEPKRSFEFVVVVVVVGFDTGVDSKEPKRSSCFDSLEVDIGVPVKSLTESGVDGFGVDGETKLEKSLGVLELTEVSDLVGVDIKSLKSFCLEGDSGTMLVVSFLISVGEDNPWNSNSDSFFGSTFGDSCVFGSAFGDSSVF